MSSFNRLLSFHTCLRSLSNWNISSKFKVNTLIVSKIKRQNIIETFKPGKKIVIKNANSIGPTLFAQGHFLLVQPQSSEVLYKEQIAKGFLYTCCNLKIVKINNKKLQ
ncbi:6357_t:CDS:2 [Gigaspora margarita]|uniref:6357_t:CDS:1 n=1 Tax=Gigaspora margarita TaxID=4874 RepID=A0ABN7UWH2_GIGMA|nr:6357_t:CDS:2 [Gigaspora margarita]